jgi:hypothetical protein
MPAMYFCPAELSTTGEGVALYRPGRLHTASLFVVESGPSLDAARRHSPRSDPTPASALLSRPQSLLILHQSRSHPARIAPTIENSEENRGIIDDTIVDGERKPLGEETVMPEDDGVDAAK